MRKQRQFRLVAESETDTVKARRWSGFVCPDCRFVFRVPRDHDGEGIICPSCRRMLRIPKEGDESAPLMAPLQKVDFAEEDPESRGEKRTRTKRKRIKKKAEVPVWDPSSGKWRARKFGGERTLKIAAVWAGLFAALVAAVYLFLKAGEGDKTHPVDATQERRDQSDNPVSVPLMLPDEDLSDQVELPALKK